MKETFKSFLNAEIENKQKLLLSNSINDEDKALIQEQIDNLTAMVEKVDALEEGEQANEAIEELKQTVTEMGEKLTALNEKLNQTKQEDNNEEKENKMENYLETKNSVRDFAAAIRASKTADEFRANWNEYLVANSITVASGSEDAFLPSAVKGRIQDLFEKNAGWLADLTNTNAKRFYVRRNTNDKNDEDSRAKGWSKSKTKVSQEIEVAAKLLAPQFIYKLQEIDLQTKFENDEDLINYVLGELVNQILFEERRAILVGDGRANDSDYKIHSFESIGLKASTDAYTTVMTATSTFLVDDARALCDSIVNENNVPLYVFMSKADLRTLARVSASETSTPVYMSTEQVAEQIGATKIFTTDLLGETAKMIAMLPSEYYLVGEGVLNPALMTAHDIYKNLDIYRYECTAGGGINGLKSTAVLKAN